MGNSIRRHQARLGTAVALIALFLVTMGCASGNSTQQFIGWKDAYSGGDYPKALEQWTREGRIYRGFELELLAHATFKSKNFRKAYVEELTRVYRLDAEKKRVRQGEESTAEQKAHEFMIATYVPDLTKDYFSPKNSPWKVYLVEDDAPPVLAGEIIRTKDDPTVRHFFPYLNTWKTLYAVRFPKAASAKEAVSMRLIITGLRGSIEMEWKTGAAQE